MSGAERRVSTATAITKRVFDIVVGCVLIVLTLPTLVVALLGSAVALRTWPVFVQHRVGLDGRWFRFLKVRTLPRTVSPYTHKFAFDLDELPAFTRFLRRFHLDELPQLLLLPLGRMSLVGPRPEMPVLHDDLPARFARARTSVRPGCTGLWQVSEAVTGLIGDDTRYDEYYLLNRTLRLDLWILWRTLLVMAFGARRVRLPDIPAWTLPARGVIDLRDAPASPSLATPELATEPLAQPLRPLAARS